MTAGLPICLGVAVVFVALMRHVGVIVLCPQTGLLHSSFFSGGVYKTQIGSDRIDKTQTRSARINKTWMGLHPIDKTQTESEKNGNAINSRQNSHVILQSKMTEKEVCRCSLCA